MPLGRPFGWLWTAYAVSTFGTRLAFDACALIAILVLHAGPAQVVVVGAVVFGLITGMGVFNPVFATYRLEQVPTDRIVRTLSAWSVTSKVTVASMAGLCGLLAGITGPRATIATAGLRMRSPCSCFRGATTSRITSLIRSASAGETPEPAPGITGTGPVGSIGQTGDATGGLLP